MWLEASFRSYAVFSENIKCDPLDCHMTVLSTVAVQNKNKISKQIVSSWKIEFFVFDTSDFKCWLVKVITSCQSQVSPRFTYITYYYVKYFMGVRSIRSMDMGKKLHAFPFTTNGWILSTSWFLCSDDDVTRKMTSLLLQ